VNKKVLIIAGEYPPIKTIGRLRTAKFSKHLLSNGWTPIIVTLETDDTTHDCSLENEIPQGIEIYRVAKPDLEKIIVKKIKALINKYPKKNAVSINNNLDKKFQNGQASSKQRFSLRNSAIHVYKQILKYLVYIPDDFNLWAFQAEKVAREICKKQDVAVVYTTLPPFSSCYVGYKLKQRFHMPWVVDYRDLWYGDVLREWVPTFRQKIELLLEKYYIRRADAVISVSEQKTKFLQKLHPDSKALWETITNGYDNEVFEPLLAQPRITDEYINFVYTGRLFKNRRGYAFAEALGQLCQENTEFKKQVRVHILGGVAVEIQQQYKKILLQYDILENYNFTGDISYHEAMQAQVNADYLLLIVDTGLTSDGVIPGKLFEYIASSRPIFALTDPGATQEIIEKSGAGIVVPAESTEQCKKELKRLLQLGVADSYQPDESYLKQFDRKDLTIRLANLFNQLINSH